MTLLVVCFVLMLGIVFASPTFAAYAAGEDGTAPTIVKTGGIDVDRKNHMGTLPNALKGVEYKAKDGSNYKIEATGTEPFTFRANKSGEGYAPLPEGLSLNPTTGEIVGTPTGDAGKYNISVTVTNKYGSDNISVGMYVYGETSKPKITTTQADIAVGFVDSSYSQRIVYNSGIGEPSEASIKNGNLPTGLILRQAGFGIYIEGTPTVADTFTFTVRLKNAAGFDEKQYTIEVKDEIVAPEIQMQMTVINDSYSKVNEYGQLAIVKGKEVDVQFYATSGYVAKYKDGVLTLNNYHGGEIGTSAPASGYYKIDLIGENTINGGQRGVFIDTSKEGRVTITSSVNGKLTINVSSATSVWGIACGASNSVKTTDVVIGGNAQVTINATSNGENRQVDGIHARNVTIEDNASVNITAKNTNNSTASQWVAGIFAENNVTINTNGNIDIDVSVAGGDSAYSYGVRNGKTMTKAGNMTIKYKKAGRDGWPITGGDVDTYDGNAKTATVSLIAFYGDETGFTVTVKYKKGGVIVAEVKDAGEYEVYIDTTATANFNAATDIHDVSWKFTIAKAEQSAPAASLFTTVAPTATTTTDGKITGITAQMEYRKVGDSAWTSGTGSDVTGLSSGRYQIRFKETDNYNAGEVVEVQVPESGVSSYNLTVIGGTGEGVFIQGESVTITANAPATGKEFDKWVVTGITLSDEDLAKSTVTFEMPASNVTMEAHFRDIEEAPSIEIKVEGGTGGGTYKQGDEVTVTAEDKEGKEFVGWQDERGKIVSTEKSYKFTVSEEKTLTAVYEDKSSGGGEITPPAKKDGLSGGQIAGIVIGSVAVAGIGGFAIFWFAVKKKTFADLGIALKKGFTAIGNFFKNLGAKIKALFTKKK